MAARKIDPVTAHRKQRIRELWETGLSCGQIAAKLGVTRNTIIGHVSRMELPKRSQDAVRQLQHMGARKKKGGGFTLPYQVGMGVSTRKEKSAPAPVEVIAAIEPMRIDGKLITLETLHSRMCKYPLGDPSKDGFHYCANAPKGGSVYCDFHHDRCHTAAYAH